LIAASSNLPMIFAAMVCLGLSQGWMSPPLMIHISKTVAPQARALAVAVVSSSILFGQFVSPLFTKAVALATGNDTFRFRFYFLAGFLVACAVIGAVALFVKSLGKVKSAEPASAPAKA
jgi:sugar phosphate permease